MSDPSVRSKLDTLIQYLDHQREHALSILELARGVTSCHGHDFGRTPTRPAPLPPSTVITVPET